ncbi:phage antirepressor KilAC domain-containing protein [Lactococcus muris]|uniref:Phage antirepressor KilAC domain-containing protein n=1 Tax=Lactococcus muris TaxID=2941330 RepID=A0ABV4D731_9LACT
MSELKKFTNGIFNLDIKVEGENILFSAEQVAKSLGFEKNETRNGRTTKSIRWSRVNSYLPKSCPQVGTGSFISEPMVYKLAFKANSAVAEKFTDWLAVEVLPTIRKHGAYMTDAKAQDVLTGNGLADMLSQAAEQLRAKDIVISEMKPKALFAESVAASTQSILIGELAKYLKQNGVDIGANRLFAWLRENGWLINRKGEMWNQPTQKGLNRGLFEIKKRVLNNPDGTVFTTSTTKVTGKGQIYFVNKFLQDKVS